MRSYRIVIADPPDYLMLDAGEVIAAFRTVLGPGVCTAIRDGVTIRDGDWTCSANGTDFELVLEFEGRAGRTYLDRVVESIVRELESPSQPLFWECITGTSQREVDELGEIISAPLSEAP